MMKPQVILWDWDNTLVDSRPVAKYALEQLGQETGVSITDSDVTEVIGGHLVDFWFRHYGPDPIPAVTRFLNHYRANQDKAALFPDTKAVLAWVQNQGIPQIVVSNKDQDILEIEAERFGIASYFEKIVGTQDHGIAKPEAAFADKVFGHVWPRSIIMIGDGESDMAFAKTIHAFGLLIDRVGLPVSCDKRVVDLNEARSFLEKEWER